MTLYYYSPFIQAFIANLIDEFQCYICSLFVISLFDVCLYQELVKHYLLSYEHLLILDELHRFSKAQQDFFLPLLESGSLTLLATTTENPSFSVTRQLLSRLSVLRLRPLDLPELLELARRGAAQMGCELHGFNAYTTSFVPKGSGLSSSAAFEVLVGVMVNSLLFNGKADPVQIAQIGQWAENNFFGKPCGLMDQMASSVGNIITIDFNDPSAPIVERVDFDFGGVGHALCILDSGADHADLTDEYAAVPGELAKVCGVFGKKVLREVDEAEFWARLPEVRAAAGDRGTLRAAHVYADNAHVEKQVAALRGGDFASFLELVTDSGRSSWECLQNVIPAGYTTHQDVAVTIRLCQHLLDGAGAVRVHGGGFAGTVQAFVPLDKLDAFRAGAEAVLGEGKCHVLAIRPVGGTELTL